MIAKTDKMMNYLSDTIKERNIDKYYIAVVFGKVKTPEFKIESYMQGLHIFELQAPKTLFQKN